MKAAEFFAAAERLPIGSLAGVTGGRGLVVVAPHPDDESLGCGGLITEACASGIPVRLIVVSDGVGSHPHSKTYPPHRLRNLREEETHRAAAELGLAAAAIHFLRLPDRHVPKSGADAEAACDRIVELAQEIDAGAICVTWEHDPHCDHAACAALVAAARPRLPRVRVFSYPIWGPTLPPETEIGSAPKGVRFDIRRRVAAKAAAIAAHRSQTTDLIDDDPDGFRLSPAMIARSMGDYEILIETDEPPGRHRRSLSVAYFDKLYARDPDPWRFDSSAYERDKYAATLAALPRAHYASALEVGCSIGILTRQLASHADALCAIDLAVRPLDEARRRCADLGHVRFEHVAVPSGWPLGRFDLIVLSEIVYYLDREDVGALAARVDDAITPGGDLILVHWLGETHYPLSGDEAADLFTEATVGRAFCVTRKARMKEYRLDVLRAAG